MTLLVERLGPERAAAVIDKAGGRRLAIPDRLEEGDAPRALDGLVGRELAIALVLHFGGETVYIPRLGPRLHDNGRRLNEVVRLTREGKSANLIAGELRCSDRTVYSHRAKARAAGLLPG